MAGGFIETDPIKLAKNCESFMGGAKKIYDGQGDRADMWYFELYHHLRDCADTLERMARELERKRLIDEVRKTTNDSQRSTLSKVWDTIRQRRTTRIT